MKRSYKSHCERWRFPRSEKRGSGQAASALRQSLSSDLETDNHSEARRPRVGGFGSRVQPLPGASAARLLVSACPLRQIGTETRAQATVVKVDGGERCGKVGTIPGRHD